MIEVIFHRLCVEVDRWSWWESLTPGVVESGMETGATGLDLITINPLFLYALKKKASSVWLLKKTSTKAFCDRKGSSEAHIESFDWIFIFNRAS